MSDTYTKLFSSITESTVWGEPYPTRIVWVTFLAMADAQGNVYGSIPGVARRANVTLQEAEAAIAAFLSPDPHSRTKDRDGRRVEEIDGGWQLVNHAKYARVRDEIERREYKRLWDRENRPSGHARRAEQSDNSPTVRQQSDESPSSPTAPTPPTPTPTPEEQDQKQGRRAKKAKPALHVIELPDWIPGDAWAAWVEHRKAIRKPLTFDAAQLSIRELGKFWRAGDSPAAVIEQSILHGWTGLWGLKQGAGHGYANGGGSRRESEAQRVERINREHDEREDRRNA